ncbi:MAG: hypothetical protein EBT92_06820 [Planctomycetes bacterium]|nr:hypothetical protein [Planctomycetota bacterium]
MNTKFVAGFLFIGLTICSLGNAQEKEDTPNLSGSWSGNWISDGSGHKGPMKAIFRSTGNNSYEVTFSGRFFKVIPFRYKAHLSVTGKDGDKLILTGNQKLLGFGTFEYNARADNDSFIANYSSKKDNGRFELYRSR